MKRLGAMLLLLSGVPAWAAENAASVRAGHDIAVTRCFSCHVATPNQTIAPIMRQPPASFVEIANRPGTTAEGVRAYLSDAHWNDYARPRRPAPMALISDREKDEVVAYIMSLRK